MAGSGRIVSAWKAAPPRRASPLVQKLMNQASLLLGGSLARVCFMIARQASGVGSGVPRAEAVLGLAVV
jgi:hypothetical protein